MLSLLLALQVHAGAPPEPLPVTLALDNGGFLQEFYWPQRGPYQGSGDWLPRASVMQDLAVSVAASSPGDFQLWVAQPPGIDPPEGPCRIEALAEARTASAWTGLDANYNGTTSTSLIALHRALGEEGPVCDTDDLADPLEGPRVEIYVFDLLEEDDREAFVADERERCIRPGRLAESISEVLAERPDHLWLGRLEAAPGPFVPNPALYPWDAQMLREGKRPRSDAPRRYAFKAASCGTGLTAVNFYDEAGPRPLGVLVIGRDTAERDDDVQGFAMDLQAHFDANDVLGLELVPVRRHIELHEERQLAAAAAGFAVPIPDAEVCGEPELRVTSTWAPGDERPYMDGSAELMHQDLDGDGVSECGPEVRVELGGEVERERELLRQVGWLFPYWWGFDELKAEGLEPCEEGWCLHLQSELSLDSPAPVSLETELAALGDFTAWESGGGQIRVSQAWIELVDRMADPDFSNHWAVSHRLDELRVEHPRDPRPYGPAGGLALLSLVGVLALGWMQGPKPQLRRSADVEAARIDAERPVLSLNDFFTALDEALEPIEHQLRWRWGVGGGVGGLVLGVILAMLVLRLYFGWAT